MAACTCATCLERSKAKLEEGPNFTADAFGVACAGAAGGAGAGTGLGGGGGNKSASQRAAA
eukprot:7293201-Lingulodinium_polyedra.AAC.1